jgi:dethiobiotin synthetase
MQGLFVTGTDTGCGKTRVAVALIASLRRRGLSVAGFKPVAAGAQRHDGLLKNDDAMALLRVSSPGLSYAEVNPFCFEEPVSPHIAAAAGSRTVSLAEIADRLQSLCLRHDLVVVEGAGGWRVPLGPELDIEALAVGLKLPILLVVGLRLGCLNHAQLSEQAIEASGAPLLGWVGSEVDPQMPRRRENLDTLKQRLHSPGLGVLPFRAELDKHLTGDFLDLDALLKRVSAAG